MDKNAPKKFKDYVNSRKNGIVEIYSVTNKQINYGYKGSDTIYSKEYSSFEEFAKEIIKCNQDEIKFLKDLLK